MLLIKLLRFIQGYVDLKAEYGFPERFINLCAKDSLPLWNMSSHGDALYASTTVFALDGVRKRAQRAGMEISVIRICSLKESLKKHSARKGLLFSLLFCIVITVILSQFIWSVSVTGNEKYTVEQILEVYEKNGVKIGAFKGKTDTARASENAMSELDSLSWAKVNIRGCFALIEVREAVEKPKALNENTPVNIVAGCDGKILRFEVSKGDGVLKPGFAVTKGDLLVSGVITNSDGSERLVHSIARVTAETKSRISVKNDLPLFSESDENNRYSLFFFGLTLPAFRNTENAFESRSYFNNKTKRLPVGIFRFTENKYENEFTPDESLEALLRAYRFNKKAMDIYFESVRVLSEKITFDGKTATGEFVCEKDIGVEQEILLE